MSSPILIVSVREKQILNTENRRKCTIFKYLQPPVFLLKAFYLKYSNYIRRETLNLPAKSDKCSAARETSH